MVEFDLRLYDANLGRWLSPDPFSEFHSPYLAMGNDPVNRIDPTGGKTDPSSNTPRDDGYTGQGRRQDPFDFVGAMGFGGGGSYFVDGVQVESWEARLASREDGAQVGDARIVFTKYFYNTKDGYVWSWSKKAIHAFREKDLNTGGAFVLGMSNLTYRSGLDQATVTPYHHRGANVLDFRSTSLQLTDATFGLIGGIGEIGIGLSGEVFTAGVSTALVVDGFYRVGASSLKIGTIISGDEAFANNVPSNIGGLVGKLIDYSTGYNAQSVGIFESSLGLINDFGLIITPLGNAQAIQSMLARPNTWNMLGLMGSYYGSTVGTYNNTKLLVKAYHEKK